MRDTSCWLELSIENYSDWPIAVNIENRLNTFFHLFTKLICFSLINICDTKYFQAEYIGGWLFPIHACFKCHELTNSDCKGLHMPCQLVSWKHEKTLDLYRYSLYLTKWDSVIYFWSITTQKSLKQYILLFKESWHVDRGSLSSSYKFRSCNLSSAMYIEKFAWCS